MGNCNFNNNAQTTPDLNSDEQNNLYQEQYLRPQNATSPDENFAVEMNKPLQFPFCKLEIIDPIFQLLGEFKFDFPQFEDPKSEKLNLHKILINDSLYEGEWNRGMFSGKGQLQESDGTIYEGYFKECQKHGRGRQINIYGDVYEGNWKFDMQNGKGKINFQSGEIYEGDFKNGEFHEKGKYTWKNGDTYIGQYQYGKRHGKGIYQQKNGKKYEGKWLDGGLDRQGIKGINQEDSKDEFRIEKESAYRQSRAPTQTYTQSHRIDQNDGLNFASQSPQYQARIIYPQFLKHQSINQQAFQVQSAASQLPFTQEQIQQNQEYLWPDDSKYTGYFINESDQDKGVMMYNNGTHQKGKWINDYENWLEPYNKDNQSLQKEDWKQKLSPGQRVLIDHKKGTQSIQKWMKYDEHDNQEVYIPQQYDNQSIQLQQSFQPSSPHQQYQQQLSRQMSYNNDN